MGLAFDDPAAGAGRTDTHVHIFQADGTLAADRRYAPQYSATPEQLAETMTGAGVARAWLVQPSFLGTDNSYLLKAIAINPGRYAGIAVVDADIRLEELKTLRQAGVIGVRLNAIGKPAPDFAGPCRALAGGLAELGMILQIQAEGEQWCAMENFLADPPGRVVIDHFGRTPRGHASGGLDALLRAAARSDRLWFKFSAPYRLPQGAADACASALLDVVGIHRILWGSDWPHTQFEGRHSYCETLGWLARWVPASREREIILSSNPLRLSGG